MGNTNSTPEQIAQLNQQVQQKKQQLQEKIRLQQQAQQEAQQIIEQQILQSIQKQEELQQILQIEKFTQLNGNQSYPRHAGCKLNRENFSVESESICDSDSCKNLIFNELKRKHEKRLQNDSVKIQLLRQRIDNTNNEIGGLVNRIQLLNNDPMLRYGGPPTVLIQAQLQEANNRISVLRNNLPNLVNELKYLLSFDIEFKELQKEMNIL
jgi:hypothetical protein